MEMNENASDSYATNSPPMDGDNNSIDVSSSSDDDTADVQDVPDIPVIPDLPTIPGTVVLNASAAPTTAESRSSSSSTSSSTDPKTWTLDDVHCSPDFSVVNSIRGMSTVSRNSGLTVVKLRTFCSTIPGLPKGYSNATKENILRMLLNRKKGKDLYKEFGKAIENIASTPVPIKQRRGKRSPALTKVGTCLRFINAFFHQEMKGYTTQLKNRLTIQDLDKRQKIPHYAVWKALETFYSMYPNEEIDTIPTTMKKWSVFELFDIHPTSPTEYDKMDAEELYLLYEFMLKKYKKIFRDFKSSGQGEDFHAFIGKNFIVAPAMYYFYLRLEESNEITHQSQVTNTLPNGLLMQSISDDTSSAGGSPQKKQRRKTASDEYKQGILLTKQNLVKSFMDIGNERRRNNDRLDAIEVENQTLRMLEIEKTQNNQFTFLFEKGNQLKRQLLDADEDDKVFIEAMLVANKKSLARIVKDLNEK